MTSHVMTFLNPRPRSMGKMASFFKICECCYPWKCPLASLHVRGICVYVFMCLFVLGDLILKWCVSNPAVVAQEVQLKLRHPPRATARAMSSSGGLVATNCGQTSATKPWLGLVAQILSSNLLCAPGGTDIFAVDSAEHATLVAEIAGSSLKLWYGRLASKALSCHIVSQPVLPQGDSHHPFPRACVR